MKKTTIQPPKNMSARKLIDTFAQNTPFTTKGIYYVSKDDVGNENTTIFLTADLDLALKAGDIAERRRVDEAMQGTNRGDIEFFSIFTN